MTTDKGIAAASSSETLGLCLQSISARLHAIPSHTNDAQIADEVTRINDAVRAAADRHGPHCAPAGDYLPELLRLADRACD